MGWLQKTIVGGIAGIGISGGFFACVPGGEKDCNAVAKYSVVVTVTTPENQRVGPETATVEFQLGRTEVWDACSFDATTIEWKCALETAGLVAVRRLAPNTDVLERHLNIEQDDCNVISEFVTFVLSSSGGP